MPPDANVESTLIWYNHNIPENFKHWTKGIDSFLKTYEPKAESKDNAVECGTGKKAPDGKFCNVSLSSFSNCVSSQNYNYHLGLPCIFLKLNKVRLFFGVHHVLFEFFLINVFSILFL